MPDNDLFSIKKRITAAQQTRKITRTMELIASSRLQRGKVLLTACNEWSRYIREAARILPDSYFEPPSDSGDDLKRAYIIFGGSRGLSGAYSPNLLQYAKPIVDGHIVGAVGSATEVFFPDAHTSFGDEVPSADYSAAIVRAAMAMRKSEEADEVYLIYTRGTRHVTARLFPLIRHDEVHEGVIPEPSASKLFPALFGEYAISVVYEAHLQAFVSEQIARVSAMDSATKNADEITEALQATYNRIRQSSITQEIITVSNAARGDG